MTLTGILTQYLFSKVESEIRKFEISIDSEIQQMQSRFFQQVFNEKQNRHIVLSHSQSAI